ncbi:hypothetical protein JTB14_031766, partial [Gonioctena quinquepunctata]
LTLAELLDELDPIDIYTDASDEDEANLNYSGPNLLSAKCEVCLRDDDVLDNMQKNNEIDNPENIFDSSKRS